VKVAPAIPVVSPITPTVSSVSESTTPIPSPVLSGVNLEDPNKKLTKEEAEELKASEKEYKEALAFVKDMIAPAMMLIDAKKLQIGDTYVRTIFTYTYPDVLEGNWLSPLINWDVKFDLSMFIYPVDSSRVMRFLKKRLTQLRSQYAINREKGLINDPHLDAQMQDVEELQVSLTR
jgi:hypothetical protein